MDAVLAVDRWPDDVPVPSFGPRRVVHAERHHLRRRAAELAGAFGQVAVDAALEKYAKGAAAAVRRGALTTPCELAP
jgi:hypothetical protein